MHTEAHSTYSSDAHVARADVARSTVESRLAPWNDHALVRVRAVELAGLG